MRKPGFAPGSIIMKVIVESQEKKLNEVDMKEKFKKALETAKKFKNIERREWLTTLPVDCYEYEGNRVEFYVLEGSPARGFIITIDGHIICRLDGEGKKIRTWYVYDPE